MARPIKGKKATDKQRDEYAAALRDGQGVPEGFIFDGRDLFQVATPAEAKTIESDQPVQPASLPKTAKSS